jgi:hypothetical protein
MNLRIVSWNVERFSAGSLTRRGLGYPYIEQVICPGGPAKEADIFIVIEVKSTVGDKGSPVVGSGADAVNGLANRLASSTTRPSNDWRVVPPLRLTKSLTGGKASASEGIAVFYRSSRLEFTGPVTGFDYSGSAFSTRSDPAVTQKLAGQVEFHHFGSVLGFPNKRNRSPWLTTFRTKPGTGAQAESFTLVAAHSPPPVARNEQGKRVRPENRQCYQGTAALSLIPELDPASRKVILTGDFNCSYADPDFRGAFSDLEKKGFTPLITAEPTTMSTGKSAKPDSYKTHNVFDNILLKNVTRIPGSPDVPSAAVVDPVAGLPKGYPGLYAYTSGSYTPADVPVQTFRSGANFGGVRGTSDHRPVYVDVQI